MFTSDCDNIDPVIDFTILFEMILTLSFYNSTPAAYYTRYPNLYIAYAFGIK